MGLYSTCTYTDYNKAGWFFLFVFFTAFGVTHMGLY